MSQAPGLLEPLMFKNQLQQYTQRLNIDLPVYNVINKGSQHSPLFKATVCVEGEIYTSSNTFSHRKSAEQDVAKFALECILAKRKIEGSPLITKDKLKDKLFDASLHKEEDFIYETESFGAGNLVGRRVENHNVQSANVTTTVPVANVQTSATPGTSFGLPLPHLPFKRPEPEPSSETVNLPSSFVPPVLRQPSGIGTSTSKKKRKNKDKANERFLADAELAIVPQPLTIPQAPVPLLQAIQSLSQAIHAFNETVKSITEPYYP